MGLLLSDNDLEAIQTALDSHLVIEMTRTLGSLRITVTTSKAPDVWQPWRWLARVEIWNRMCGAKRRKSSGTPGTPVFAGPGGTDWSSVWRCLVPTGSFTP